jgi:uncharacterized protein YodC (DUF2158 family)
MKKSESRKNTPIKVGDKVRKKTGGPEMRVEALVAGGRIWCRFRDEYDNDIECDFHISDVVLIQAQPTLPRPCVFVVNEKHPEYRRGQEAYRIGLTVRQHGIRKKDGFNDGLFHWLAGWYAARTNARLAEVLPPGVLCVNRMAYTM